MTAFRHLFHRAMFFNDQIELSRSDRDETDAECGIIGSFIFDIYLRKTRTPIGYVSVRIGESASLYYLGHIGYRIHAPYRGHHYAEQACRLLEPFLLRSGIRHLTITNDPDNLASRKTCEHLGCILERIVPVPAAYRRVCSGSKEKCRYIWMIRTGDQNR